MEAGDRVTDTSVDCHPLLSELFGRCARDAAKCLTLQPVDVPLNESHPVANIGYDNRQN